MFVCSFRQTFKFHAFRLQASCDAEFASNSLLAQGEAIKQIVHAHIIHK